MEILNQYGDGLGLTAISYKAFAESIYQLRD